jgi:preprotein translocase subunit SecA
VIDTFWVDHLEAMDYLRSSVNLRAYGQRDPLVEYKKEGLRIFKEMETGMQYELARLLPHIDAGLFRTEETKNLELVHESAQSITGGSSAGNTVVSEGGIQSDKIGRNDMCPCGSGKKYKKCGELNTEEHQQLMSKK